MDWSSLESQGWEKVEEVCNGKKKTFYRSPPINGIRKKITQSKDLKGPFIEYASILFPKSNVAKRHQAEQTNNQSPETQTARPSTHHLASNPGMYIFLLGLYLFTMWQIK